MCTRNNGQLGGRDLCEVAVVFSSISAVTVIVMVTIVMITVVKDTVVNDSDTCKVVVIRNALDSYPNEFRHTLAIA